MTTIQYVGEDANEKKNISDIVRVALTQHGYTVAPTAEDTVSVSVIPLGNVNQGYDPKAGYSTPGEAGSHQGGDGGGEG